MTDVLNAAQALDANGRPIYGDSPFRVEKLITLVGNNTTVNVPIFTITGTVLIRKLWGEVKTVLGVNHTASALRINDQGAQIYLTAVAGVDISAKAVGSIIAKKGVVATAIALINNVAGAVSEPTTLQTDFFTPVLVMKKTGALTQVEYHYATTDAPTSGAIKFFAEYQPISEDGLLTAV